MIKMYNCPDCERTDSCDGCFRVTNVTTNTASNPFKLTDVLIDLRLDDIGIISTYVPEACRNCGNHPSNGGSGVCHCVMGSPTITC